MIGQIRRLLKFHRLGDVTMAQATDFLIQAGHIEPQPASLTITVPLLSERFLVSLMLSQMVVFMISHWELQRQTNRTFIACPILCGSNCIFQDVTDHLYTRDEFLADQGENLDWVVNRLNISPNVGGGQYGEIFAHSGCISDI